MQLPLEGLARLGHECVIVPELVQNSHGELAGKTWERETVRGDVIITQRWMTDDGEERTRRARAFGQVVVGDVDDHYWALPTDNAAFYGTHPKVNPQVNRDHYRRQLSACSLVTVSTPLLADVCSKWNKNTVVLRNAIDPKLWWGQDTEKAGKTPVYGWTGGTLWRQRDLRDVAGYVGPFFKSHPELSFAHVGARDETPQVRDLLHLPDHTVVHDWAQVPFPDFPMAVKAVNIQVCLVPLQVNSFNDAKSALKGLEATVMGMPFIATASPEYQHYGIGRLVRKPREWPHALREMLDPATRADYVKAAQARVAQEHIDVRAKEWEEAYLASSVA